MRLDQLLEAENIVVTTGELGVPVSLATADSRKVTPGAVFFAIKGSKVDGNQLIPQLLKQSPVAVVSEEHFPPHSNTVFVRVKSARRAYAYAVSILAGQPSSKFSLIGVTGTNGKTTTTYLLHQAMTYLGTSSGLIGTTGVFIRQEEIPSELTTPGPDELQSLFSRMAQASIENVAMEVSSIALDQFRPWGSRFQVGVFTNLTQDHLDYHHDFENYFRAKARFFSDYVLPVAVINADDPYGARLLQLARSPTKVSFGITAENLNFHAKNIRFSNAGLEFDVVGKEGKEGKEGKDFSCPIVSPLIGRFNVYNLLAAFATLCELSVPPAKAAEALRSAPGAAGRLERVATGSGGPHAFVDYAHSPDALLKVLQVLREVVSKSGGRVLTVFGCGGDRDKTKRPQMGRIAKELSDVAYLTSDNPRTENPERIIDDIEAGANQVPGAHFRNADRKKAIGMALENAKANDIVLVAGKGHETYQIIGEQKLPFDDREVIRSFYS